MPRQKWMSVESIPQPGALSHGDTVEVTYHYNIRVLLPALDSLEDMHAIEAIQRTFSLTAKVSTLIHYQHFN